MTRCARRTKDELTFRAVVEEEYLATNERQKQLRPRSLAETKRYLTGSYFTPLHTMPIDKVTRRDVATRVAMIANQSGGPTATQARAVLSAMFSWAMMSGIIEANPVLNTPEPSDSEPRERTLTDAEVAAIWTASGTKSYGVIIKLLILLGSRRAEIGDMRWSEFSDDGAEWTLPKERGKNGRAHKLPLPPMAQAIIASVPPMISSDHLFVSRRGTGFKSWHMAKVALDARAAAWLIGLSTTFAGRSPLQGWPTLAFSRISSSKF